MDLSILKKALILVALLLSIFIGEILFFDKNSHAQDSKPFIVVTNFPIYEISLKLLNENVEVKKLIPFGVETHTYTPSVKTMTQISKADLFIYSGLGMEPWIRNDYKNSLDMSQFVTLHSSKKEDEHEGHVHSGTDPHYWLDISNMIKMTKVLSLRLQKQFPLYKDEIILNGNTYIKELEVLKNDYAKTLKECKYHEIVVNHNAFGYIGEQYKFHSHALTGLSPDERVSAKKMAEITDLVKSENIKVIFFESFVSPKVSQTISKETGAKTQSLQPLANVTKAEAQKGYIFIMRDNLNKLSNAMECK